MVPEIFPKRKCISSSREKFQENESVPLGKNLHQNQSIPLGRSLQENESINLQKQFRESCGKGAAYVQRR